MTTADFTFKIEKFTADNCRTNSMWKCTWQVKIFGRLLPVLKVWTMICVIQKSESLRNVKIKPSLLFVWVYWQTYTFIFIHLKPLKTHGEILRNTFNQNHCQIKFFTEGSCILLEWKNDKIWQNMSVILKHCRST